MADFARAYSDAQVILMEGSVIERLRREFTADLDPYILNAGLIYQDRGRNALSNIYTQYLDVGRKYDLPMIVLTPTWRANPERLEKAGFSSGDDVNGDAVRFLLAIKNSLGEYVGQVYIGGLMGPSGDAYKPEEALSEAEATGFHRFQVKALANAGVDFLIASTLPSISEALGIAKAMSASGLPYIVSFVIRPDGNLLDGTLLTEAIANIDSEIDQRPLCFMVNCVHPVNFEQAMESQPSSSPSILERLTGLQANASARSPEELDGLDFLDSDSPESLAVSMLRIHQRYGIKILGGCCGTNHKHIGQIAKKYREFNQ